MTDFLAIAYLWIKSLHIMAVMSWMAGLFYLPRLFVYHAERATPGDPLDETLKIMEAKLLRLIMNPAMIATWIFGLLMVAIPGLVDWHSIWPWTKAAGVIGMTWFHHWLGLRRKELLAGTSTRTGRDFRLANEIPTFFMVIIVFSVVVKF